MKKYLTILVFLFLSTSCIHVYFVAPRYLRKKGFTYRCLNEKTGLENKLNINGYFTVNDTLNSGYIYHGYTNIIFFSDGMFVSGFHNPRDSNQEEIGKVIPRYINSLVKQEKNKVKDGSFYKYSNWGHYKLTGDTIRVQHIFRPWFGDMVYHWDAYEIWFKIIDKNNIVEINRFPLHRISDSDLTIFEQTEGKREKIKAYFRPLEVLPSSDGWLKYEKWFWNDGESYQKWKK